MTSAGTGKRVAIVAALAAGRSYDQVAAECHISKRTLVRYMAEPAFREEVQDARARLLDEALALLAGEAAATVRALVTLRDGAESEATRLGACRTILERLVAAQDLAEIQARLAVLEQNVRDGR